MNYCYNLKKKENNFRFVIVNKFQNTKKYTLLVTHKGQELLYCKLTE